TRGLVPEKDVEQLQKLAKAINADFDENLALSKNVSATNVRGNSKKYAAANVTDDNPDSYWATDDQVKTASLEIDFQQPIEMNRFLVQEDIRLGQRVKEFSVEAFINDEWKEVAHETTIGRKRILRFPNITAHKLRFNVIDSKACPVITNIEVYKAPKVLVQPEILRDKNGMVTIKSFDTGLDIYYTINNSVPSEQSEKYSSPFLLNKKAIVKAVAVDPATGNKSPVTTSEFDIPHTKWKMIGMTGLETNAENCIDGNPATALSPDQKLPVDFIVDLGESYNLKGFKYLPDQGRWNPGIIFNYEFYVSSDGKKWGEPVSQGEFSNIKNSPVWQEKQFEPVSGRFIKLRALSPAEENGKVGIAELDVVTQ
ncbi:MAG TPA: discoidin domain-containing protein, partial [Tangfeifania sp.]|nr:discoidin domain-containing protein [Tangfeifania sp.]